MLDASCPLQHSPLLLLELLVNGDSGHCALCRRAFGEAIRGHKLVDEKHALLLLNGPENPETVEGAKQSFGFMTYFENGVRVVGHDGGFNGISTCFAMLPEKGYTVIVLSNYDDVAPIFALQARRWITG